MRFPRPPDGGLPLFRVRPRPRRAWSPEHSTHRETMLYHTPWGHPQQQEAVAPGITRISTASHGGYHVDAAAVSAMPPALAAFGTFAGGDGCGGRWFEEDEDWCIVALAFPRLFQPYEVWSALRTFECCARTQPRYAVIQRAFTGPSRAEAEGIAAAWFDEHRDHWHTCGYSCGPGSGWIVRYEHLSSGEAASREVSSTEFRSLSPVVSELPGVPFTRRPRAASVGS